MKRLAIYAHYSFSPEVAGHVLFCLRHIAELGFQICFVSNSEISPAGKVSLGKNCERVIVRENSGLDFAMWLCGMAEYDLLQFDELLLTNSSIIGPLQPLAPLWQSPALAGCDFWGLTDNDEFKPHLSSYFLVFRQRVLHSERFREFWRTVLPYKKKWQVIFSYELGLSDWLEEGGFQWRAVFPQKDIIEACHSSRGFWKRGWDRWLALGYLLNNRRPPPRSTTLVYPDILLQHGMPFLKVMLLHQKSRRITPAMAFSFLKKSVLPAEVFEELRRTYPI